MANLFTPEISDMPGSSVSAYKPASYDFSAVANFANNFITETNRGRGGPTETSTKNDVLAPFLKERNAVLNSDMSDIEKRIKINTIDQSVAENFPAYYETFKNATGPTESQEPIDYMALEKQAMAEFAKSAAGQIAVLDARNTATDLYGNFNTENFNESMAGAYYKYRAEEVETKNLERRQKEQSVKEGDVKNLSMLAQNKGASRVLKFVTPERLDSLTKMSNGDYVQVLNSLTSFKATLTSEVIGYYTEDGLAPPSEADLNSIMNPLDAQIEYVNKLIATPELQNKITEASTKGEMYKNIPKFAVYNALPPLEQSVYITANPDLRDSINNFSPTTLQETLNTEHPSVSMDSNGATSDSVPPNSVGSVFSEWDVTDFTRASRRNQSERKAISDDFNKISRVYNPSTASESDTKIYSSTLGKSLLNIASRPGVDVIPVDQADVYFGTKTQKAIAQMYDKDIFGGKNLYLQYNKTALMETDRAISKLMGVLNYQFEGNSPIYFEMNDSGKISMKLKENGRKDRLFYSIPNIDSLSDEELIKAAFEPSYIGVVGNYLTHNLGGGGGSNTLVQLKELVPVLESLNRSSDDIPNELKRQVSGKDTKEIILSMFDDMRKVRYLEPENLRTPQLNRGR